MAEKSKPGPKTGYRAEYCDLAIEAGKAGKSLVWVAAQIGVTKQTVFNWIEQHPEFAEAMALRTVYSQACWEDIGQSNLVTPGFSASCWSRSMAARFPDDWREVKGTELSAPGGGPVQLTTRVERVIVDVKD